MCDKWHALIKWGYSSITCSYGISSPKNDNYVTIYSPSRVWLFQN